MISNHLHCNDVAQNDRSGQYFSLVNPVICRKISIADDNNSAVTERN